MGFKLVGFRVCDLQFFQRAIEVCHLTAWQWPHGPLDDGWKYAVEW